MNAQAMQLLHALNWSHEQTNIQHTTNKQGVVDKSSLLVLENVKEQ